MRRAARLRALSDPTDPAALAMQARTALATTGSATLMISGIGRLSDADPVTLLEDEAGVPTLLCEPGSRVGAAVGNTAILTVPGRAGGTVAIFGRLERVGIQVVDETPVDVAALRPGRVAIEQPTDAGTRHVDVPVEQYLAADWDQLCSRAARLVRHANGCHEAQLRHCVARRVEISPTSIAVASLTWLDPTGAEVQWVDGEGSHLLWLPFASTATTADELTRLLNSQLV